MEGHYIPKYLNALPQILWWEADEAAILGVFTAVGVAINATLLLAATGFVIMKVYAKAKNKRQDGFLYHWLYSKGLFGMKGIPESYIKIFYQ